MKKQRLRYLYLLLCGFLALQPLSADDQVVTMATSKVSGDSMSFVVNKRAGISIDWGDGEYVSYTTDSITGTLKGSTVTVKGNNNWKIFSCEGNQLQSLTTSSAPNLQVLFCGNNELTTLTINKNVALTDLSCHDNQLSTLSTIANTALVYLNCANNNLKSMASLYYNKNLETLICSGNQISTLTAAATSLKTLWCENNNLSSLNASQMSSLTTLVGSDNKLKSINLGEKDSLQIIWIDNNVLTTLDLSQAPMLNMVNCSHNDLNKITYYSPSSKKGYYFLNCGHNNLLYSSLIVRTMVTNYETNYIYYPQSAYKIPTSIDIADTLDLSDTRMNAGNRAVASYRIYDYNKNLLAQGTDFRLISGQKIKFNKAFNDSVCVEIYSTRYFPDLTFTTNYTKVTDAVPVRSITTDAAGTKIFNKDGAAYIQTNKRTKVSIYTTDGVLYWNGTVEAGEHTFTLPKGTYIINSTKIII